MCAPRMVPVFEVEFVAKVPQHMGPVRNIARGTRATVSMVAFAVSTFAAARSAQSSGRKKGQLSCHSLANLSGRAVESQPSQALHQLESPNGLNGSDLENLTPLIFPVTVLTIKEHTKSSGRFEVATVLDPEFPDCDCTLKVVVRSGEFKAGQAAFFIKVGAKVPQGLAQRCGWEGLLAESDYVVKPSHFGRGYLSNGLLLPTSLVEEILGFQDFSELRTFADKLTAALTLSHASDSAFCARSFLLDIGFDNTFYGSQWTGTEDQRPTVLGQILGAVERLGICPNMPRMSQWVALSRVDSGVSARSFKIATPPLHLGPNLDLAKVMAVELPPNISIHNAIAIPRGVELSPAQRIVREYGYYLAYDVVGNSGRLNLETLLQGFCGEHCFANFTDLKKLEGLKKKIQRNKELQTWAHELQSWKRSRRIDEAQEASEASEPIDSPSDAERRFRGSKRWGSPVSNIKVHQAMRDACKRNILSIIVERVERVETEGTEKSECTDLMCIRIKGDGFLYNMVRYLVGCALAVATGRLSADNLHTALEASICVDLSEYLAPAHGLVLLDQSLEARWMSTCSESTAKSADGFCQNQLLPKIKEAWHQNEQLRKGVERTSKGPKSLNLKLKLNSSHMHGSGSPRGRVRPQSLGFQVKPNQCMSSRLHRVQTC